MIALGLILALCAAASWSALYGRAVERRWPAEGRFVDALGARAHVVEVGQGAGILLLHGASGSTRDILAPLAPHLPGLRLIAIDRPSHGYSGELAGGRRLERQAHFIAEVLASSGAQGPLTVVGHSWGAAVALRLALDHPQWVRALVLLAPASHPAAWSVALHNRLASLPGIGLLLSWTAPALLGPLALKAGLKSVFHPAPVSPSYVETSGIPLYFRAHTFAANARDMASASAELAGQSDRYRTLTVPAAIVTGQGDTVVSNAIHAASLAHDMPHAEQHRVATAGHMPQHVNPSQVAAIIARLARS
jgi:pimeloyl-ACP methyl ester carboxylesterase